MSSRGGGSSRNMKTMQSAMNLESESAPSTNVKLKAIASVKNKGKHYLFE